ncbi:PAS domain S-box protein, partial [Acinetobacter baumannii]
RNAAGLIQQREADLAETEARYRAMVDTAADAMVVIDDAGIIQSFNPAAERIFDYRAEEAVGRSVRILMPEPCSSANDIHIMNCLRTGER